MIRRAQGADLGAVVDIYEAILRREQAGLSTTGWQQGVYPTARTARDALEAGWLFVLEWEGEIAAAAKINRVQEPSYADCPWEFSAPESAVMVLHTLVVDPARAGRGLATQFVRFYEAYALENGCTCLRMDTNVKNTAARALYKKLGYREPGTVACAFNGIPGVELVCLEKKLVPPTANPQTPPNPA